MQTISSTLWIIRGSNFFWMQEKWGPVNGPWQGGYYKSMKRLQGLHKYLAIVRSSYFHHTHGKTPRRPRRKCAAKQENDQCVTHRTRPSTKRATRQEISKTWLRKKWRNMTSPLIHSYTHSSAPSIRGRGRSGPPIFPTLFDLLLFWPPDLRWYEVPV